MPDSLRIETRRAGMGDDFRSERMETPEGKGNARRTFDRAWAAYSKKVNKVAGPVLKPVTDKIGAAAAVDLVGFWLAWHAEGGFEGLRRLGMSRSAIYRRLSLFRKIVGVHPDEYQVTGVTIDVEAYLKGPRVPETV
jgi:hypothetical protein